ncbi:hypothetical protein [Paraburkholderia bryophila]|uniref:Uncharacterized protein n=1 Tax=Paraburkholderia bryophila TaxID=420952 RepID=A0A329BMT9_9BURK|nr:hypothetical protein [Paraburkholderia bryophila]RAS23408.1 hypothetical protein BX591_12014 [Paraburkholderia bryophila]
MKSEIRRIAFTCDFFRADFERGRFDNYQYRNLDWLYAILGADEWAEDWGVEIGLVVPDLDAAGFRTVVGNDGLFHDYTRPNGKAWPSVYDVEGSSPCFSTTFDRLSEYDLIVGFELSPTIKRNLDLRGTRYISLHIHPVRFLRDICFFAVTNWPHARSLFDKVANPSSEIGVQVRRWRALFARRRDLALNVPRPVPIVVGQTHKDAAVISNGAFATLASYGERLAMLLEPYSEVLFLGHPFESRNATAIEYLRVVQGKSVISIKANGYGVIFSPEPIPLVVTLSSSLGVEAALAGRETSFLLASPIEHFVTDGVDIRGGVMIGHALLTDFFAETLFCGESKDGVSLLSSQKSGDPFFLGDDYLRKSLESWSFDGLQRVSELERVRRKIFPAASLTLEEIDTLFEEHGGKSRSGRLTSVGVTEPGDAVVEVLPRPCAVGSDFSLKFSAPNVRHYLTYGFHDAEQWGVWSNGREGHVQIPVDVPKSGVWTIELEMSVLVVEELLQLAPVLQLEVYGVEVAMVLFRSSISHRQQIRVTVDAISPLCEIRLALTHTTDDLVGAVGHERTLGFALSELRCAITSATGDRRRNPNDADGIAIFGAAAGGPIFVPKTLTA